MAKVSAEDLEDIKERFDMYDKKGDGKVWTFELMFTYELFPMASYIL